MVHKKEAQHSAPYPDGSNMIQIRKGKTDEERGREGWVEKREEKRVGRSLWMTVITGLRCKPGGISPSYRF